MPRRTPSSTNARPNDGESPLTSNDTVYQRVRREIATGALPPGTQLVHRKLAQRMGTSTIPVVDALRRLEGAGLLESTPGQGTRVRRWEPHEIHEAYLIRAAHDGVACRLFAQRATADEIAAVEALSREFDAAAQAGQAEECGVIDERLHLLIAQGARSRELLRLVENSGLVLLTIGNTMLPPEVIRAVGIGPFGIHTALMAALKSGDPELAEREGREHVLEAWRNRIGPQLAEYHKHLRIVPD